MIYTVRNTASAPRVFYDARNQQITLNPGSLKYADIDEGTVAKLRARNDLVLKPATFERNAPIPPPAPTVIQPDVPRPTICVTGHFGIGDNLHQRAVMRELMKTYDVWLHTCHFNLYHDLIDKGLKLILRSTRLHAQAKTVEREHGQFVAAKFPAAPPTSRFANIGYPKAMIDKHGSILEAMFGCVELKMPERPDFSLPIKPEWRQWLREKYLCNWDTGGKPLLVHRPITLRREWDGRSRNPDPRSYHELYRAIREQFFVVSLADLARDREWIDGPQQDVDVRLYKGELTFEEMAALFSEADLIFCNAGFAPVLAQAVGTPVIVVYGGRESFRTTQRAGAHLAPTLPIDVIHPCDCHSNKHNCNKKIDVPVAWEKVKAFASEDRRRSTLVFGTFFVDSPDRENLTELWKQLHLTLNADCDFLAVDSQSPIKKFEDWHPYDGKRNRRMYFNFPDNVGHLSRPKVTQGRDGWGRAFCKGLEIACELGYEYVAHIEGDSLLRLRVCNIVQQMKSEGVDCASTAVRGMKHRELEQEWVETGLMFFSTAYLTKSDFVRRYDWPNRKPVPTPERFIRLWILNKTLDKNQLRIMQWKALRADKNQITKDNVVGLDLDWITHQHDSAQQGVYRAFVDVALRKEVVPDEAGGGQPSPERGRDKTPPQPKLKLNLGCGDNKLAGWENHDSDVDITKPLPWRDGSVSHISIEHCVEHVPHKAAIGFFKEAHRVLAPGGVLRVTVPSLQQIADCGEQDYYNFTTKWQDVGATKRGAMHAIIYAHGHEMIWNARLMQDVLYFCGFDDVKQCQTGESEDEVLRGVEGHGKVIGDKFNRIESCTHEARKSGTRLEEKTSGELAGRTDSLPRAAAETVAIVIGGAECWESDLEKARALIGDRPFRFYYINDHIGSFPEPGVACTLHPDKLNGHVAWLPHRRRKGLPEPEQIWSHRKHPGVTHDTATKEWAGSSGLFAVQVARRVGHRHIIACGVPMTIEDGHYERHVKWQAAIGFRNGWIKCKNDLAPFVRSMSGWTAAQFGKPDEEWLR